MAESREAADGLAASSNSGHVRTRVSRACDRCNSSRLRCNGAQPCQRCVASMLDCTYSRNSRRKGRKPRHAIPSLTVAGAEDAAQDRQRCSSFAHHQTPAIHHSPADAVGPSSLPLGHTPPCMQEKVGANGRWQPPIFPPPDVHYDNIFSFPDLLDSPWAQPMAPWHPPGEGYLQFSCGEFRNDQIYPGRPTSRRSFATPRVPTSIPHLPTGQGIKYPVLSPVMPYISSFLTPSLTCALFEAYIASNGGCIAVPSSPLLIGHIFRVSSLTSIERPRCCTPALLASMLLVAANTTESPFFGRSPFARMQLTEQLLRLSMRLLEGNLSQNGPHSIHTCGSRIRSSSLGLTFDPALVSSSTRQRRHTAYLDDIVTYLHIGLVTATAESKPVGSRWWHTAFQLAKDFKLYKDIHFSELNPVQGEVAPDSLQSHLSERSELCDGDTDSGVADEDNEPPIDVTNNSIVDRNDYRFANATLEELEERRRVWWTLYIWDKQLALSYNSPLAIKDSECQNVLTPMDDILWQHSRMTRDLRIKDMTDSQEFGWVSHQRGIPMQLDGNGHITAMIPLMSVLSTLLDLHHALGHPQMEEEARGAIRGAYRASVRKQLASIGPSIDKLHQSILLSAGSTVSARRLPEQTRIQLILICYIRFLYHVLHVLLGSKWDMLEMINSPPAYFDSGDFQLAVSHCVGASHVLKEVLRLTPDLGFRPFFFGVFLFQASAVAFVAATTGKTRSRPEIISTCETFARVLEATIATNHTEYLRKMRRLLLMAIDEANIEGTHADVNAYRNNLLSLYRWTSNGTGLGL